MRSFWISEVFLLLSVVELEAATSVSQFCYPKRNLTVTVDDAMILYIDGVEITGNKLPNAETWKQPDVVDLPCTTRLIAIHGRNSDGSAKAGILASTDDDYVVTNSSWKCSNVNHSGWQKIDFDDSDWMSATGNHRNVDTTSNVYYFVHGIRSDAVWMWLPESNGKQLAAYCRKRLGYDCCCYDGYTNDGSQRCRATTGNNSTSSIVLGVFFGVSVIAIMALISVLWVLHLRKQAVKGEVKDQGQSGVSQTYETNIALSDEQDAEDSYECLH